ncbi:hypothetical protein RRG08_047992 [Elysia crispata]|uniref:Uncharacterized protein n=1 Tax=Elysia crispata TaxID=231223 RepID=A0AAE0ZVG7_9GAST|nr:hypothetical protein RRG08_047992 [Elysia crispata]
MCHGTGAFVRLNNKDVSPHRRNCNTYLEVRVVILILQSLVLILSVRHGTRPVQDVATDVCVEKLHHPGGHSHSVCPYTGHRDFGIKMCLSCDVDGCVLVQRGYACRSYCPSARGALPAPGCGQIVGYFQSLHDGHQHDAVRQHAGGGIYRVLGHSQTDRAPSPHGSRVRTEMLIGSEPRWLMLGLMLATWVLSMWISNMATAAMMIPITEAVLQQLEDCSAMEKGRPASIENDSSQHSGSKNGVGVCGTLGSNEAFDDPEKDTAETPLHTLQPNASTQAFITSSVSHGINGFHNADICDEALDLELGQGEHTKPANFAGLSKGMSLCICYAANIGGVATLTGTGPNMIMKGNTDRLYKAADERNPINFGSWMGFAIPLSLILLLLCWVWLQLAFFDRGSLTKRGVRHDPTTSKRIRRLIQEEYNKLGPLVFGQILVLVMFVVLVILWITRDIGGVAGWGRHFKSVSNSLPGILVGILMFALPSSMSCVRSCSGESQPEKLGASTDQKDNAPGARVKPLMNWEYMNRKMPWQLVLLLGGGFAISEGFVKSGLSVWIGDQLYFFRAWNEWLVLLVFCFITASATELASNNAICSVLLPIMEELAPRIGAHPLLFIIPVTLSTSFAFMLPVATPTNAIVFTYGRLKTMDMAKAGLILNLASVPCTVIMTKTLGAAIFDLGEVPEQFLQNATALVATP